MFSPIELLPPQLAERVWTIPGCSCWIYDGRWNTGNGYSKIRFGGRCTVVHRVTFALLRGPIDDGVVLDHRCDTRWCVNPWHLEPVTVRENTIRGRAILYRPSFNEPQKGEHRG